MGPLYGMLFRGLAKGAEDQKRIEAATFGAMLLQAQAAVQGISEARQGDKTLMDALIPAVEAYHSALESGRAFSACLEAMARAAESGRDSTRDMVARVGRASRLGERSRGTPDPGAASCALILTTMAASASSLIAGRAGAA